MFVELHFMTRAKNEPFMSPSKNPIFGGFMRSDDQAAFCLQPIMTAKDLAELAKALQLLQATVRLQEIHKPDINGYINDWSFEQRFYFGHFTAIQSVLENYKQQNYALNALTKGAAL